jgi:hypothetical protein
MRESPRLPPGETPGARRPLGGPHFALLDGNAVATRHSGARPRHALALLIHAAHCELRVGVALFCGQSVPGDGPISRSVMIMFCTAAKLGSAGVIQRINDACVELGERR